ncbi:MAG TPA: SMC-Scp complex subunit ScpB [Fimbriimonadaceae bacterium]|nr:SMC-Scp complex subunit ScpB [Fimbriimonadaceae bacterium]
MNIVDQLEALLFVSDAPVPVETLAMALGGTEGQVEQGIEILEARLEGRGAVRLTKIAGGYQLSTKPEHAELVANYLKPQRQKLSRSLMEVLAIVAYRQPLTVTDIETVRGVQSDYSVKALQERRLIAEVGRKQAPGRPVLYGTTDQFLHQFNLNDLSQLPAIEPDDNRVLAIVVDTLSPNEKNESI